MKETHYYLTMESKKLKDVYIDYNRLKGFKVTPKNKVQYDGVVVNQMVLINPSFIERVLKRKIKRKLDTYLEYIVQILDDTDDHGNLTVKNKIYVYLEYIMEAVNTINEDSNQKIKTCVQKIQKLLEEAERNRIARKIHQALEPILDSMMKILNQDEQESITFQVKINLYLNEIFKILEEIDDEDGGIIEIALNDLDRYRRTIINKYRDFLDAHYVELLLKKIDVLERELRLKQVYKMPIVEEVPVYEEEEKEIGRRSR